jgi:probable HAF family extracellular repeat protein
MVDIGTLSGHAEATAYAVNNSGMIVGSSWIWTISGVTERAFSYTTAGGMIDLGSAFIPVALNDSGQMAGSSTGSHAVFYSQEPAWWILAPSVASPPTGMASIRPER